MHNRLLVDNYIHIGPCKSKSVDMLKNHKWLHGLTMQDHQWFSAYVAYTMNVEIVAKQKIYCGNKKFEFYYAYHVLQILCNQSWTAIGIGLQATLCSARV